MDRWIDENWVCWTNQLIWNICFLNVKLDHDFPRVPGVKKKSNIRNRKMIFLDFQVPVENTALSPPAHVVDLSGNRSSNKLTWFCFKMLGANALCISQSWCLTRSPNINLKRIQELAWCFWKPRASLQLYYLLLAGHRAACLVTSLKGEKPPAVFASTIVEHHKYTLED